MSSVEKLLDNITIVLVKPKYSENVGAAARVALNMGITDLVIVCDKRPDLEGMLACATHNAKKIISTIKYYDDLSSALTDYAMVIGATARHGRHRQSPCVPNELSSHIIPILGKNRVAIVFGPENRGLDNNELKFCTILTSIPTAEFSSLNLAQAVAIICYEIYGGIVSSRGVNKTPIFTPRLATVQEKESMFTDLRQAVNHIDHLADKKRPASRVKKLRDLLNRTRLQAKETRVISEVCRQLILLLKGNTNKL